MGGLVAGITLTLIHLISIPVDNTSVNPARSLGTALFADAHTDALQQLWAFIVFPLIGAVVGVIVWLMLDEATARRHRCWSRCRRLTNCATCSSNMLRRHRRPRATDDRADDQLRG